MSDPKMVLSKDLLEAIRLAKDTHDLGEGLPVKYATEVLNIIGERGRVENEGLTAQVKQATIEVNAKHGIDTE